MQYPLNINFKIAAFASQIKVFDSSGKELFYVKQKLFKLKENINVYSDSSQSQLLYTIKADRVIDFSPEYTMAGPDGQAIGTIKRHGAKSMWKASYTIELGGQPLANVSEESALVRFFDNLMVQIPIVSLLSGYVFQPKYLVSAPDGQELAVLEKKPAFLEGKFELAAKQLSAMDEASQSHLAVLLMVVTLLERMRA
jgi:uncharacterized protein YxjI